ncbi:DWNN domain-containing protein [Tanacetum coccineum]
MPSPSLSSPLPSSHRHLHNHLLCLWFRDIKGQQLGGRRRTGPMQQNQQPVPMMQQQVDFTCYMCGSPDHLISDCPIAHAGDPMFPGVPCFVTPSWVGASAPEVNSHMNMCKSLGVVPFGGNMIPFEPYSVPDYLLSLFNSSLIPRQCSFDYENNVANKPPYEDLANREGQPGSSSSTIHHEAEKELGGIRTALNLNLIRTSESDAQMSESE